MSEEQMEVQQLPELETEELLDAEEVTEVTEVTEVAEVVEVVETVEAPEAEAENLINSKNAGKEKKNKTASLGSSEENVIGTPPRKTQKAVEPVKEKTDTVAIHSEKNVVWEGVGKVKKGYNIVTKEKADKWLTRSHTRIATPEEVARQFG